MTALPSIASIYPRVIVGISGTSGAAPGVRFIELLAAAGRCELHVVMTAAGEARCCMKRASMRRPKSASAIGDCRGDGSPDCDHHRPQLKDVETILDAHSLGRDVQLAEAAMLKLAKRTKLQAAV